MSDNATDYGFDEYNKPGAERSRRRRGEGDNIESDLEEDLLEDDWLSAKKNPSEGSDEELNDDLLQSDEEDVNMSGLDVNLDPSYSFSTSYDQQDNFEEAEYTDDVVNLGAEGCNEGEEEEVGYQREGEEGYTEGYGQDEITEMPEDQATYADEQMEGDDGYPDEVLDIQINEPIDGEFQEDDYQTSFADQPVDMQQTEVSREEVGGEEHQEEERKNTAESSQVFDTEQVENETKEESDEEDEEDGESGRIRFKSERKDCTVVRPADASARRNIPETLELSEKAKQDLMEYEEQERQKRQNRYGVRGGRGGIRGGRGRGVFSPYGMADFRGNRGRMNEQMLPLMGNMGKQLPSSRMPLPHHLHHQQVQSQHHHLLRPRGPHSFQEHGRPLTQSPLQPLIALRMAHRSPPLRPQMEPLPRMMSSPPPNFPPHHHHQQQQQQPSQPSQPKNIHINPHFRGPSSSSVQVPLMPPAQSQPRPAVSPQRFPGPGDFQQHMSGHFGQPQRPPHHVEPFRSRPPPQIPQEREPLFMAEHAESMRFPGQHMFDHQGPGSPMNSGPNLHHQQPLSDHSHMGFGPPGPAFNQPGQGPLGIFPREPPRPSLPPHQGHQGMVVLNQQGCPPNQPRPFLSPRQPFGQQGNVFPPPQIGFGMQVRLRGLMHRPPILQVPQHDPMPSLQPVHHQHHRQELPHHQQNINVSEPRPMMHHGQNSFHQQATHGSPRQMSPHLQSPQQRIMSNRHRMISKQIQQRNSNLRELPVAPGNANTSSARPAANVRPVAKATQAMRAGQSNQPVPAGGRGRGQVAAKNESQPRGEGRTVVCKEIPSTLSSTAPQDVEDEDEETRQYRIKIEEQKRLREEILRKKEMRRQMQAGVRKKELLDRLNSQSNTPSPTPASSQIRTLHPNQQIPNPVQQHQLPQMQQQQQQEQRQGQPQQQRQFPPKTPPSLNQTLNNPYRGSPILPYGSVPTPAQHPSVKARFQMVKGSAQQQQHASPGLEQQWKQPQQNQQQLLQQRNCAVHNVNRAFVPVQSSQMPQKNIPGMLSVASGQAQSQGPKPGTKRTVMQRVKSSGSEGQQVPQKVRLLKLSGAGGKGPGAAADVQEQQQDSWSPPPVNQAIQRKVTMAGQQQQAAAAAPRAGRGAVGNPQQNRVVVSGRGQGRGVGQPGRGRPVSTRPAQRDAGSERCTVSIEGLSSSTTDLQLTNLLQSVGPIEMFKMMPQQRKAIAKFSSPQHAASFQLSFHRHMIDLSHIDVLLIDG
ncbi:RNA-binding protein 33 [Brachionichthys hirsutus]|uniref:RNA-binding protein 33 n=1 Tax=Brachionichthys hirsutus TaxID=412623 RepID=UPI0036047C85